jgi:hypothetical protein
MNKAKITIIALIVALIASNALWAYRLLDTGVTLTYTGVSLQEHKEALNQTLVLLPVVAQPGITREKIISAVRLPGDTFEPFEKDGFLWVGRIGLKFDDRGQLIEASRAWSPP